jgi:hypothetical protein
MGDPRMSDNRTKEQVVRRNPTERVKVMETDTHQFFMDGFSRIVSKEKDGGGMLESQSMQTLLLLDIAQSLRQFDLCGHGIRGFCKYCARTP